MSQPRAPKLGITTSTFSPKSKRDEIQDIINASGQIANKIVTKETPDHRRGKGELSIFSNDYARDSLPEHRQVKGVSDLRYHNQMNG